MYLTASPSISIGTAYGYHGDFCRISMGSPPLGEVYGKSIYKWMSFLGVAALIGYLHLCHGQVTWWMYHLVI